MRSKSLILAVFIIGVLAVPIYAITATYSFLGSGASSSSSSSSSSSDSSQFQDIFSSDQEFSDEDAPYETEDDNSPRSSQITISDSKRNIFKRY